MSYDLGEWARGFRTLASLRAYALLEAENIGQLEYWRAYGAPPADQRTFALGYLAARGLLKEGN